MKTVINITVMLSLGFLLPVTVLSQQSPEALKQYLAGQKLLVTYRQGGPVYGTYFFLQVHLCRSGNYVTYGQSRKQSVLDSHGEQVHSWRDEGHWDVGVYAGQVGVQYVSTSGQANFVPVRIGPNGEIWTSNGTSVVRQGAAQCS